jgi:hypothetical protein
MKGMTKRPVQVTRTANQSHQKLGSRSRTRVRGAAGLRGDPAVLLEMVPYPAIVRLLKSSVYGAAMLWDSST